MVNQKCSAATWCVLLATPHSDVCRLHLVTPLLNDWETKKAWVSRVNKELNARKAAAAKAAKSDATLRRGR